MYNFQFVVYNSLIIYIPEVHYTVRVLSIKTKNIWNLYFKAKKFQNSVLNMVLFIDCFEYTCITSIY